MSLYDISTNFTDSDSDSSLEMSLALIGEVEGDLEFFHELFDDVPDEVNKNRVPKAKHDDAVSVLTLRDHRRRERWLALEETDVLGRLLLGVCNWRQLAQQQKRKRDVVEKENAQLRKLVHTQTHTATKMMKLVHKASLLSTHAILVRPTGAFITPYVGASPNLVQIQQQLDVLAQNADAMLATSALASAQSNAFTLENRMVQTRTGEALETTVEIAWLLPFDIEIITRTVVANIYKLVTTKGNRHMETVYNDDTMKVVRAVSRPKEKNGFHITKHGQLTTRREPPRSDGSNLVLMLASGGFVRDGEKIVSMEGAGYILVSAVPGHDHSSVGPLSRVRWYRQFRAQTCKAANLTPDEEAKWIQSFTSKSGRKAEKELEKVIQAMENLLLASRSR